MIITESLAKGLKNRFFLEISDEINQRLKLASLIGKPGKKSTAAWLRYQNKFKENTLSFPQVQLRFEYEEGVPINLYIQKTLLNDKETKWCYIISIQDLRNEHKYAHGKHLHPITRMPTEIQGLHDFHRNDGMAENRVYGGKPPGVE